MIGVVLLVQFLPRLLKRDMRAEEQNWLAERQKEMPSLVVKQLLHHQPEHGWEIACASWTRTGWRMSISRVSGAATRSAWSSPISSCTWAMW